MLATLREPGSRQLLINFAAFELGWLACVLGGSVIGALAAAALIALHLARQARPGEWRWLAGFAAPSAAPLLLRRRPPGGGRAGPLAASRPGAGVGAALPVAEPTPRQHLARLPALSLPAALSTCIPPAWTVDLPAVAWRRPVACRAQ